MPSARGEGFCTPDGRCRVRSRGSILGRKSKEVSFTGANVFVCICSALIVSIKIHTFFIVHSSIDLHFNWCIFIYSYK